MPRGGAGRKFKKREELARVGAIDRLRELRKQKDKLDAEIIEILELYPEYAKGLPGDEDRPKKVGRPRLEPAPQQPRATRDYRTEETREFMRAMLKLRAEMWGGTKRPANWPKGAKVILMAHKQGLPISRILRPHLERLLAKEGASKRPPGRPKKAGADSQPVLPLAGRPESGRPAQSKPWHRTNTPTVAKKNLEAAMTESARLVAQQEARAAYEAQRQQEEKEEA